MPTNKKNLLLSLGILAVFISALLIYGLTAPIVIRQPVSDGTAIRLDPLLPSGQSFYAHYPGLTRISVQTGGIENVSLDSIEFQLTIWKDGTERLVLSTEDVRVSQDLDWIHFHFLPQSDTPDTRYAFYLIQEGGTPLSIQANRQNMYPEGTLQGGEGDLVFEAGFRPSAKETLSILMTRLAADKPGLLGSPWTYVLLLAGLFAAFVGVSINLIISEPCRIVLRRSGADSSQ
jgi:hypothetical protein